MGSMIYKLLSKHGYEHESVNRPERYVNPTTGEQYNKYNGRGLKRTTVTVHYAVTALCYKSFVRMRQLKDWCLYCNYLRHVHCLT